MDEEENSPATTPPDEIKRGVLAPSTRKEMSDSEREIVSFLLAAGFEVPVFIGDMNWLGAGD